MGSGNSTAKHLPSMCKALGSLPSTTKNLKRTFEERKRKALTISLLKHIPKPHSYRMEVL
jgi:hypothetical protein